MLTGGRVQLHEALARVSVKSASITASSMFQVLSPRRIKHVTIPMSFEGLKFITSHNNI